MTPPTIRTLQNCEDGDEFLSTFYETDRNFDGTIDRDEFDPTTLPIPDEQPSPLDTYDRAAQAIRVYQSLSSIPSKPKMDPREIWTLSAKSEKAYLRTNGTIVFQLAAEIDRDPNGTITNLKIPFVLLEPQRSPALPKRSTCVFHLFLDPTRSAIETQQAGEISIAPLEECSDHQTIALLSFATEHLNEKLRNEIDSNTRHSMRRILFYNYETVRKGSIVGHLMALPLSDPDPKSSLPLQTTPLFRYQRTIFRDIMRGLSTRYLNPTDFSHTTPIISSSLEVPVIANSPVSPEELEPLKASIDLLPPSARDYYAAIQQRDPNHPPLSVLLLSDEEYQNLMGDHHRGTMTAPQEMIILGADRLSEPPLLSFYPSFIHEIAHTLLHQMTTPSLWNDRESRDLDMAWHSFLLAMNQEISPDTPEDPLHLGDIAPTLGILMTAWPTELEYFLAQQGLAPVGLFPDFDGVIAEENYRVKTRAPNTSSASTPSTVWKKWLRMLLPLNAAAYFFPEGDSEDCISEHANWGFAHEFAAETLTAYLLPEAIVLDRGIYNSRNGLMTRERLMEKHPAVYLAYELFFSPYSPVRFNPRALNQDHIIRTMLAKMNDTGEECRPADINSVRNALFEVFEQNPYLVMI